MSWIEFLAWQRYANKRAIERINAERRQARGEGAARASSLGSDEWAEFQEQLNSGG